jgi:hypothetical protein
MTWCSIAFDDRVCVYKGTPPDTLSRTFFPLPILIRDSHINCLFDESVWYAPEKGRGSPTEWGPPSTASRALNLICRKGHGW